MQSICLIPLFLKVVLILVNHFQFANILYALCWNQLSISSIIFLTCCSPNLMKLRSFLLTMAKHWIKSQHMLTKKKQNMTTNCICAKVYENEEKLYIKGSLQIQNWFSIEQLQNIPIKLGPCMFYFAYKKEQQTWYNLTLFKWYRVIRIIWINK